MAGNSKSKHLFLSLSVLLGRRLVLLILAVEAAFGAALEGRSGRTRSTGRPDGDLPGEGDRRRGGVRGLQREGGRMEHAACRHSDPECPGEAVTVTSDLQRGARRRVGGQAAQAPELGYLGL